MRWTWLISPLAWICPLLTSCTHPPLSVHTDYLTRENLASYYVSTPDPRQFNPPEGQRLIVSWNLPKECNTYSDLHLLITMRFNNGEQIEQLVWLKKLSGTYVYPVLNDSYCETGGIQTYKVDVIGNGSILYIWRHQVWADRIILRDCPIIK